MTNEHLVKIFIPSELGYEKIPMAAAATVAQRMGFSPDRIEDLKMAVGEAVVNAIEHGNQHNINIKVMVELTVAGNALTLNVVDAGHKPIPEPPEAPLVRDDPGGLGMWLIKQLMDEVVVSAKPGRNEIRMVIYLEHT
jgi:serine/threonine-protein kinase RsbW